MPPTPERSKLGLNLRRLSNGARTLRPAHTGLAR